MRFATTLETGLGRPQQMNPAALRVIEYTAPYQTVGQIE